MTTAADWSFLRHRTIDLQSSIESMWPNLGIRPYDIEKAVLNEALGILREIRSTCDNWQDSKSHDSRFTNIVGGRASKWTSAYTLANTKLRSIQDKMMLWLAVRQR
jgi:hypothetical protein